MKIKLTIFLFFWTVQIFAQPSIVSNPKNNFIYNGVYTPIHVMLPICDYDSLSVKASHGDFKKVTDGYYTWTVCESEKIRPVIYIQAYQNGNLIYEDESEFFLKFVPNPTAMISCGNRHFGEKHISECYGLASIFTDFDYEVHCEVQAYKIRIFRSGKIVKEWENNGSSFEEMTRNQLREVIRGDFVVFLNIKTRCGCEQLQRNIQGIEVKI